MHLTIPSQRNFHIYHQIDSEGRSRRSVAVANNLSHTRVCQIFHQVRDFIARQGASHHWTAPRGSKEIASANIAYDRLDQLYQQSLAAWRDSTGQKTVATKRDGYEEEVTRTSCGEPRFLQQALRCTLALVKVARQLDRAEREHAAFTGALPPPPATDVIEQPDDDNPDQLVDPVADTTDYLIHTGQLTPESYEPHPDDPCASSAPNPQSPAPSSNPLSWASTPPDSGFTPDELQELTALAKQYDARGASPALAIACVALHRRVLHRVTTDRHAAELFPLLSTDDDELAEGDPCRRSESAALDAA